MKERRRVYGRRKIEFETNGYMSLYNDAYLGYSSDGITWSSKCRLSISNTDYELEIMCLVHEKNNDSLIYVISNSSSTPRIEFQAYHVALNSNVLNYITNPGTNTYLDQKADQLGARSTLGLSSIINDGGYAAPYVYGIEYDDIGNYLLAIGLYNDSILLIQYDSPSDTHSCYNYRITTSDYYNDDSYNITRVHAVPYLDNGIFKCLTLGSGYYNGYGVYREGQYTKIITPGESEEVIVDTITGSSNNVNVWGGWRLMKTEYGIFSVSIDRSTSTSNDTKFINIYKFNGSGFSSSPTYTFGSGTKIYYGFSVTPYVDRILAYGEYTSGAPTAYISNVIGSNSLSFTTSRATFSNTNSGMSFNSQLSEDMYANGYYGYIYHPSSDSLSKLSITYKVNDPIFSTRVSL